MNKKNVISSDGVELTNGIRVYTYHVQDCCECVYADWESLKDTTFEDEDFNRLYIVKMPNSGFRINGYFVPCYNTQNGYYSNDLTMIIEYSNGNKEEIDITDCNQDNID